MPAQYLEAENRFLSWLEKLNPDITPDADRKPMAELRKSLSFDLGTYFPSYRYVEGFLGDQEDQPEWNRRMHYLVAGLYALNRSSAPIGKTFGQTVRTLQVTRESKSIELRFLALLAADREKELAYHLRQLTTLVKAEGIGIDFALLLADLKRWRSAKRYVQQRWARGFYAPKEDEKPELKASEAERGNETEAEE